MDTLTPTPTAPLVPTNTPAVSTSSTSTSDSSTSSTTVKPGLSTTEFWFTFLITAVGLLMGSGLITNNTALQITGFAAAVLKSGFYLWSRTQIKIAASGAQTIVMVAVVLLGSHVLFGCAAFTSGAKAEGKVALDCVHADSARSAIAEYGPIATALAFTAVQGDGQVLQDRIASAFSGIVSDAGKCVALDAVAKLTKPQAAGAGAAASSASNADPASARAALAALKSQLAPGREVILEGGS